MAINLENKQILISGASVAGPALAYWLHYYGFNVTVIERSPSLRLGGYKIDTRGKCIAVLKAMGLYEKVQQHNVHTELAIFVNDEGNIVSQVPANELGMRDKEDVELLRGDLSSILYEATHDNCEYIFNDSIKSIHQNEQGIEVHFMHGTPRKFDLVIGADGIHSNVRSLVFGDESKFLYDLGRYYYAIYTVENHLRLSGQEIFYSKDHKQINLSSTKINENVKVIYIFRDTDFIFNYQDIKQQKATLLKNYAHLKWETPTLLKAMDNASDFYFDAVQQVRMNKRYKNRVALIGDAAYSPALTSGQGSSAAIVGAYVLAGELFAARGNYKVAFANYNNEMKRYIIANQKLGETVMHFLIPKNKSSLQLLLGKIQSWIFRCDPIKKLRKKFHRASNGISLKKYR